MPGKRNQATDRHSNRQVGWFSYLSHDEQELLNDQGISLTIAGEHIFEDYTNGVTREQLITSNHQQTFNRNDVENSAMFRNTNNDAVSFFNSVFRSKFTSQFKVATPTKIPHDQLFSMIDDDDDTVSIDESMPSNNSLTAGRGRPHKPSDSNATSRGTNVTNVNNNTYLSRIEKTTKYLPFKSSY